MDFAVSASMAMADFMNGGDGSGKTLKLSNAPKTTTKSNGSPSQNKTHDHLPAIGASSHSAATTSSNSTAATSASTTMIGSSKISLSSSSSSKKYVRPTASPQAPSSSPSQLPPLLSKPTRQPPPREKEEVSAEEAYYLAMFGVDVSGGGGTSRVSGSGGGAGSKQHDTTSLSSSSSPPSKDVRRSSTHYTSDGHGVGAGYSHPSSPVAAFSSSPSPSMTKQNDKDNGTDKVSFKTVNTKNNNRKKKSDGFSVKPLITFTPATKSGVGRSHEKFDEIQLSGVAMTVPFALKVVYNYEPDFVHEKQKEASNSTFEDLIQSEFASNLTSILNSVFSETHLHLNNWNSESEVSRINQNAHPLLQTHWEALKHDDYSESPPSPSPPIPLSQPLSSLLKEVFRFYDLSNGAFDPAVGPAVTYLRSDHHTNDDAVMMRDEFEGIVSYSNLRNAFELMTDDHVSSNASSSLSSSLIKKHPSASLDFCGISKGYTVDRVVQEILKKNTEKDEKSSQTKATIGAIIVKGIFFDWGGDVRAFGVNREGNVWTIGVVAPPSIKEIKRRLCGVGGNLTSRGEYEPRSNHDHGECHECEPWNNENGSNDEGHDCCSHDDVLNKSINNAKRFGKYLHQHDGNRHYVTVNGSHRDKLSNSSNSPLPTPATQETTKTRNYIRIISLDNASAATSGDYENVTVGKRNILFNDNDSNYSKNDGLFCTTYHPIRREMIELTDGVRDGSSAASVTVTVPSSATSPPLSGNVRNDNEHLRSQFEFTCMAADALATVGMVILNNSNKASRNNVIMKDGSDVAFETFATVLKNATHSQFSSFVAFSRGTSRSSDAVEVPSSSSQNGTVHVGFGCSRPEAQELNSSVCFSYSPLTFHPTHYQQYKLLGRRLIAKDTFALRFGREKKNMFDTRHYYCSSSLTPFTAGSQGNEEEVGKKIHSCESEKLQILKSQSSHFISSRSSFSIPAGQHIMIRINCRILRGQHSARDDDDDDDSEEVGEYETVSLERAFVPVTCLDPISGGEGDEEHVDSFEIFVRLPRNIKISTSVDGNANDSGNDNNDARQGEQMENVQNLLCQFVDEFSKCRLVEQQQSESDETKRSKGSSTTPKALTPTPALNEVIDASLVLYGCFDQVGIDCIEARGPYGDVQYIGGGRLTVVKRQQPSSSPSLSPQRSSAATPSIPRLVSSSSHVLHLNVKAIGLIAAGTGIAPIYNIMSQILMRSASQSRADHQSSHDNDGDDLTQIHLLVVNRTEDDMILFDELHELKARFEKYSGQVKLWFTLTRGSVTGVLCPSSDDDDNCDDGNGGCRRSPPKGKNQQSPSRATCWPYSVGRVTEKLLREQMVPPRVVVVGNKSIKNLQSHSSSTQHSLSPNQLAAATKEEGRQETDDRLNLFSAVIMCGPPAMIQKECVPALRNIGFADEQLIIL